VGGPFWWGGGPVRARLEASAGGVLDYVEIEPSVGGR
jgi:hypothetical protein